jgi:hypothetical protein
VGLNVYESPQLMTPTILVLRHLKLTIAKILHLKTVNLAQGRKDLYRHPW